jgi:methionyl-tRNA formyltransferase
MSPNVVFMGTPEFAEPILDRIAQSFNVVGIITQPDRPSGRGRKLIQSPVKLKGEALNIEVFQPSDINSTDSVGKIRSWNPEIIAVAAFGQILTPEILTLPPQGCLNVHASLLPRWRGASPINAAILNDDKTTGVTIIKMAEGLDDGPILSYKSIKINTEENAGELSLRLAKLGADLLAETIPLYIRGEIQLQNQDHTKATYAHKLKKKDGLLDFNQTANYLARKTRAYTPWPGTYTFWKDLRLIIHQTKAVDVTSPGPGVFTIYEGYPAIGTADGLLILEVLQAAGKKALSGDEFLTGAPDWVSRI